MCLVVDHIFLFFILFVLQTVYPTVRTIHSTPQVGNLQQQVINATQPRTITGTQQVIHAQPQTAIVHGAQTSAARVPQQVIQMAQLPTGNKHVSRELLLLVKPLRGTTLLGWLLGGGWGWLCSLVSGLGVLGRIARALPCACTFAHFSLLLYFPPPPLSTFYCICTEVGSGSIVKVTSLLPGRLLLFSVTTLVAPTFQCYKWSILTCMSLYNKPYEPSHP